MVLHYLKTALRYLSRHRLHAVLNVAGLAVGLACCLIIALFVIQQLSFDRHYANAERIYRIGRVLEENEVSEGNSILAAPLLQQDFAGIERAVSVDIRSGNPVLLARDDVAYFEDGVGFADQGFFELFEFQWLQGDPADALAQPNSIVLTQTLAAKYFGTASALGETLLMEDKRTLLVTGVIADLPVATHLRADAFVSMDVVRQRYADQGFDIGIWNFAAVSTYVLLREGTDIDALASRFPEFVARYVPTDSSIISLAATPLTDIHLQTRTDASIGSVARLFIFSSIAFCILLIAGINFVNFATAHASWRMLEVGLRKSMGASRSQLVQQFLGETCLMILLASLLALGLVELLLPGINAALGLELSMAILREPGVLAGLCMLVVLLGVAAGTYPAFYLSGFRPSQALDGKAAGDRSSLAFRNVLVVLQFSIAIALLITSAVVFLQMRLASSFDPGYDTDQVVEFALPPADSFDLNTQWEAFRTRLLQTPGILAVTHSLSSPLLPGRLELNAGREESSEVAELVLMLSDSDFFATYAIPLVAGRAFSNDSGLDSAQRFDPQAPDRVLGNVLLNETGAIQLGWSPQDAVGQFIRTDNGARYGVIGVVADTVPSLKEGTVGMFFMRPAVANYARLGGGTGALRISGADLEETLAHIDSVWREFSPNEPIRRQFVSDQVSALYRDERMQGTLFSYATFFAVLIACSGLLGLAAFSAERRTREIGVRKVLGGSVWSIVLLLTNDFSRLVLLSNLIAWPVAYFTMERWLENFAYRIDMTPLVFIGSGLIALCIAWVTVGGTAAKAASAKPVLALRYE